MKKRGLALTAIFILLIFAFPALSLEVDVDELRKGKKITFQNYKGKIRKYDSSYAIHNIGIKLARKAKSGRTNVPLRYYHNYSITIAVSKKEPGKLNADVFSIDKNARVGNIRNVQRILEGYFYSRYNYSWKEARTLALFTTYYNAVYRGNLTYFNSVYKSDVMIKLKKWNAGISTKYWQWPGRTKMLIPLTTTDKRGKIKKIDPFIISDKNTRDVVRKDRKNLDDRKNIVNIKDKIIKKEEKDLRKDRKKIDIRINKIQKKKEEIRRNKEKIKKQEEMVKKIKDPKKRKKEKEKIRKAKKRIKNEEDKINYEKKKVQGDTKRLLEKERDIKKKKNDLKEEKKEIEKDENKKRNNTPNTDVSKLELKKKEDELKKKEKELDKREDKLKKKEIEKNIFANKLFYLKIKQYLKNGHYNNEMYMIDLSTGKIAFKSPVTNICGNKYYVYSQGVVVITHNSSHASSHYLTMLDRKTLKPIKKGKTVVLWRSFIEIQDGYIYAIVIDGGKYYLGCFDKDLKLVRRSEMVISQNTFISMYDNKIFINGTDGKILILRKKDMKLIQAIEPQ